MKEIYDDENNSIDINQLEFLSNIGQEYRVFKYDKDVIKIFKKDYKLEHTSKKTIEYLKKIETKRILMPTGFIKDKDNNLIGYKMKYVFGNRFLNEYYVEDFFMELTIIKDDIEMLSNNGVRLLDINKNILLDQLLFSQKYNPYMFRQIVQFLMKEKKEKNIIYNLDILKLYLDPSLKIQDAIEKFVSENIKENVEERKLFEKMFIDYER